MTRIVEGGLGHPHVEALLAHHRAESRAETPAANAHSLDSRGLAAPDVRFFSAWEGEVLMGIGALRRLDATHGELKSMRTDPAHLRKGVSRALLAHIVTTARAVGIRRLSVETGTAPMFLPANTMYEKCGFVDCAPFAGYPDSPHNRFMTISLG